MTDHPDAPLTPPETLEPPKPVKPVAREQADQMVPLDEATQALLDEKVTDFIDSVILAPVGTEEFQNKVMAVHSLGNEAIRESASVSNRFLERPMNAMKEASDSKSKVSKTLVDLRKTVEDLDPARQSEMFAPKKLFGVIPLGKNVRDYFLKYQSAQGHLDKILEALYHGQDELRKDNATVEEEKVSLWETMKRLESYIYLAKKVDAALETRVTELERMEPEKARVVKEEMLFYVRQKVQDLQTQLAVSIQGYLALDLVRKNNLELIKGVDRASTTTVSALRTAVMVSQGLANQKLVLNQISAAEHHHGQPHRIDLVAAQKTVYRRSRAGRGKRGRRAAASKGVSERLRRDGRGDRVPRGRSRRDERNRQRALRRNRQVQNLP